MTDAQDKAHQIAGRARLARENAGLSQGQAAQKLGLGRSSVTELEAGNRRISATELAQMAKTYGVSMAWLGCSDDEEVEPDRDRIELAARELARLRRDDLESVLRLVRSIRSNDQRVTDDDES